MAQVVFLDRLDDPGAKTVSTMGSQPGPVGGDGWSVVAELPTARLQASRHYAFWVTGRIGNLRTSGATPQTGLVQLCLGDASGTKSPVQLVQFGAADQLGEGEGIPFAFLLVFSASPIVADPVWGPTWPNASNLQLLGRTWWRNDVPAYVAEWDVTDLCWVWADLDAIPAGEQLVTVETTPAALGSGAGFTPCAGSINTPGAAGETWAHFWSVAYEPGVGAVPAFQAGRATGLGLAGFVAKNGSGGRLGYGHRGTATAGVRWHHGAFWVEEQDGATYLPALRGRDRVAGAAPSTFQRFACLSIRLDNLEGVVHAGSAIETNLVDDFNQLFLTNRRFPVELVGQARSWQPWLFVTGIPDLLVAQRRAVGVWTYSEFLELFAYQLAHDQAEGPHEGVACYASGATGIGATSLGIQYKSTWLERNWGGLYHHVRDIWFLAVYPVKDPDNAPPTIPSVGDPTEIVPGQEGLGVGSLSDLPLQPDSAVGETPNWKRESLQGVTGYRRTWGIFTAPRRSFLLTWSPVSTAQRDQLLAFLRANQAFRWTPPRELAAVPVVQLRAPVYAQDSAQTWRVDLEVAELIYTGP